MNHLQEYKRDSNGMSQNERLPRELGEDFLKLDCRTFDDLLRQMALFSKNVGLYDDNNELVGNWSDLFGILFDGLENDDPQAEVTLKKSLLEKMVREGNVPPHMALIMAFLRLYQVQQKNFNSIVERHLQFFYKDVWGFEPKKGVVGKVTLFLDIAKGQESVSIPKGTLFDAGKDASGKLITYASVDDMVLNKAKVKSFWSCVYDESSETQHVILPESASLLTPFLGDTSSSSSVTPMVPGSESASNTSTGTQGEQLNGRTSSTSGASASAVPSNYGFFISSPYFNVQEEDVSIEFKYNEYSSFKCSDFRITYSGKSGWNTITDDESNTIRIPEGETLCPYDKKTHGEGFDSRDPIIRFEAKDLSTWRDFISEYPKIIITIGESQNLIIKNKYGIFPNQVGVLPFGSICRKGDHFTISSAVEQSGSAKILLDSVKRNAFDESVTDGDIEEVHKDGFITFTLKSEHYDQNVNAAKLAKSFILFARNEGDSENSINLSSVRNFFVKEQDQSDPADVMASQPMPITLKEPFRGCVKITIDDRDYSFKAFTPLELLDVEGVRSDDSESGTDVVVERSRSRSPLEGKDSKYQPDYKNTKQADSSDKEKVQEESADKEMYYPLLFPEFGNNISQTPKDDIMICLENITSSTVLSLYFRVDPLLSANLASGISPNWYYMTTDREWSSFSGRDVLKDSTFSLRRSGVINLRIPQAALLTEGGVPSGQVQIKVSFDVGESNYKAIQYICTQAVEVEYSPNSLGVVTAGTILPANTIKKTLSVIPGLKKVKQPYEGEFGEPDESDLSFKCRVSERLRHKGRAWTSWDYERLVLEKFPQIALVKCSRTTGEDGLINAGSVTLVVIPKSGCFRQKNYCEPKISEELRTQVYNYLKDIASPFVDIRIADPIYVKMSVTAEVNLKRGYVDVKYYKSLITERLVKFIAPWSDDSSDAFFTARKSESDIVSFLENIEFVDSVKSSISVTPENETSAIAIYTSAIDHQITCKTE